MITQENSRLNIAGSLTFDTVTALRDLGSAKIQVIDAPVVDFSQVDQCDSSALVLLLAWLRAAQLQKKTLVFQNVPQQLLAVAHVCGIKNLLFDNVSQTDKS